MKKTDQIQTVEGHLVHKILPSVKTNKSKDHGFVADRVMSPNYLSTIYLLVYLPDHNMTIC